MRLIPVIDVRGGVAVHAVGGRRHEYRPLNSSLVDSTDPVAVAGALVRHHRPAELYLADLDAIAGGEPALATYAAIRGHGVPLWVDAGVADEADAARLADAGLDRVVVGLETLDGAEALARIIGRVGAGRVVFSLDLVHGWPTRCPDGFPAPDPAGIARFAVVLGVRALIVLDLARVGGGEGAGTEELVRRIKAAHPGVEVYAGGGVAGPADVAALHAAGVAGVLVASALHDGRIGAGDPGE